MNVVAIVQARMGSERLPGKVLLDIGGKTMLARVVERARRTAGLNELIIATTTRSHDDAIVDEARMLGVRTFRGNEQDVLDRFYQAAKLVGADAVVRITADCPLIDPEVTGKVLVEFLSKRPDLASLSLRRTYPRGLDTSVVAYSALERAWREARDDYQREHVTVYISERPDLFRLLSVESDFDENYGHYRWTVDTPEDLQFVRCVYEEFRNNNNFGWRDVLNLLKRKPHLAEINSHIQQKSVK